MTPVRQRILAALLLSFGGLLLSANAVAEEAPDASLTNRSWLAPHQSLKPSHAAGGTTVGLGRSLAVLAVTGVIGGTALYLRRRKSKPARASNPGLRVLSSTRVGNRAELVLAEVGGRRILLGVTDSAVRKLGWIEADEQEDARALPIARPRLIGSVLSAGSSRSEAPEAARAGVGRGFRDVLKDAIGLGRSAGDDSAASELARQTEDTFSRSTPKPSARRGPLMVDVEGQAQGLLARLREPRP